MRRLVGGWTILSSRLRGVNEEKGESDRGKVSDIKDGLSGTKGQVIAKMKWKGDREDIGQGEMRR